MKKTIETLLGGASMAWRCSRAMRLAIAAVVLLSAGMAQATMLIQYTFDGASGTANEPNAGTLGSAADGIFNGGAARLALGGNQVLDLATGGGAGTDFVDIATAVAGLNNLSAFTITGWVNLQDSLSGSGDRIVDNYTSGGGFLLQMMDTDSSSFRLRFGTGGGGWNAAQSTDYIDAADKWAFVAATFDDFLNEVKFYVGDPDVAVSQLGDTTADFVGAVDTSDTPLRVGAIYDLSVDRTPPAWMDDIRIYDTALLESELEAVRLSNSDNFPLPQPGDANGDGVVDGVDASQLAANWLVSGAEVTWAMGDFNGDLIVNDADATLLATNWQWGISQTVDVPEPGTITLLILGVLALMPLALKRSA